MFRCSQQPLYSTARSLLIHLLFACYILCPAIYGSNLKRAAAQGPHLGAASGQRSRLGPAPPQCDPSGSRSDCGYYGIQQAECEGKGCCWSPALAAATNVASTTTGTILTATTNTSSS
ncbi:hypothetical protein Agub_g1405, partial [Astrephomene gubernaculifera]